MSYFTYRSNFRQKNSLIHSALLLFQIFCETYNPGVHADPDNCSGYIMCDMADNTYEMPCPPGLMFNPDILVCDWPENVDCEVQTD